MATLKRTVEERLDIIERSLAEICHMVIESRSVPSFTLGRFPHVVALSQVHRERLEAKMQAQHNDRTRAEGERVAAAQAEYDAVMESIRP
jgi:hypothetical protein